MSNYSNDLYTKILNSIKGKAVVAIGDKKSICSVAEDLGIKEIQFHPNPELSKDELLRLAASLELKPNKLYVTNNLEFLYTMAEENKYDFVVIRTEKYKGELVLSKFSKSDIALNKNIGYDIR